MDGVWVSRVWEAGLRLSLGQLLETRLLLVRVVRHQAHALNRNGRNQL